MTLLEVLIEARERIADIEHWTTRATARTEAGEPVEPEAEIACTFCAAGSVEKSAPLYSSPVGNTTVYLDAIKLLNNVSKFVMPGCFNIIHLNDFLHDKHPASKTSHARVLYAFDIAIIIARECE